MKRPLPPQRACEYLGKPLFLPAPKLAEWARATFLDSDSRLYNEEHRHLLRANIAYLWTNVPNKRAMRTIIATAEMPQPKGGAWKKGREEYQLDAWFGDWFAHVDFLITVYAPYAEDADHWSWCATIEHELYHCAQARNARGALRFNKETGKPIYAMKGHDVEEHTGVVERYGARAAGVLDFVAAANRKPKFGRADIVGACGTCLAKAA
jgi:hypothetical protein